MKSLTCQSLLALSAFLTRPLSTRASPFPAQFSHILQERACENPCGFYGQLCCSSAETCYTDSNGQAACRIGAVKNGGDGNWEYYTTTYTQTDLVTVTSTGSRWITEPTSDQNAQCRPSFGETPCGNICCSAAQMCESLGQCVESGGSPIETPPTASPTPPSRPTSTVGATVTATATVPFVPAVGNTGTVAPITGGEGGLSGGAIAGIVIGALVGAFILLLLCACFCIGSCLDRVRGLLGLGNNRGSSYTGSESRSSRRRPGRTWYGARPSSRSSRSSKKGGFFGMGSKTTFALIAGAIAVCLGLRKKDKGRSEKSDSYYDGSSYYYYGSSSSSSSRPTRRS